MTNKLQVQLRDVVADDLPLFFEHQRDPIAVAMVAFNSRDRAAFDEHWAKLLADETKPKKTIVADGQVVGNIGSWLSEGKQAIGYWLDRECLEASFSGPSKANPHFCKTRNHSHQTLYVVHV